jgi:hypothetical protein
MEISLEESILINLKKEKIPLRIGRYTGLGLKKKNSEIDFCSGILYSFFIK